MINLLIRGHDISSTDFAKHQLNTVLQVDRNLLVAAEEVARMGIDRAILRRVHVGFGVNVRSNDDLIERIVEILLQRRINVVVVGHRSSELLVQIHLLESCVLEILHDVRSFDLHLD